MEGATRIARVGPDGLIDPSTKEKIALALVRSGRDVTEAAAVAGLSTAAVIRLWQAAGASH
jgi:hypothetical protein